MNANANSSTENNTIKVALLQQQYDYISQMLDKFYKEWVEWRTKHETISSHESRILTLEEFKRVTENRHNQEDYAAKTRKSAFNFVTNSGVWRLLGIGATLLAFLAAGGWGADKIYHKASPDQQKYIQSLERQNQALEAQVKKPTN